MLEKVCAYCHRTYYIKENATKKLKYCSKECAILGKRSRGYDVVCPICGTMFHTTCSEHAKYCSAACYAKAQTTQEHKTLRRNNLIKKYGVTSVGQLDSVKKKREQTTLKHYGVKYAMQATEVKEKAKKTCNIKYGVDYAGQAEVVKEKSITTCRARYGCDYVLQSKTIRDKSKNYLYSKEGIYYPSQRKLTPVAKETLLNKNTLVNFILSHENRNAALLYTELGVDDTTFYAYVDKYNIRNLIEHTSSSYEIIIKNLFPNIEFIKDRKILEGKEIDLYAPALNFGIEFNGNYWHSDACVMDKYYHYNKSILADSKGVTLFHIFEWEWNTPKIRAAIISRLQNIFYKNKDKLFARKCVVKCISGKEAQAFYRDNHVQGGCPANVHVALFYGEILVAVMSFTHNSKSSSYAWELCRFANKKGSTVVGGASKLFSYFIKNYNPESIISYSDIAKTTGNIYKVLGFKLDHISHPQYRWISNGNISYSRYQCQLKQLIKRGWKTQDDGLTEEQVMRSRGFYKLYDCGKKVWVFHKS